MDESGAMNLEILRRHPWLAALLALLFLLLALRAGWLITYRFHEQKQPQPAELSVRNDSDVVTNEPFPEAIRSRQQRDSLTYVRSKIKTAATAYVGNAVIQRAVVPLLNLAGLAAWGVAGLSALAFGLFLLRFWEADAWQIMAGSMAMAAVCAVIALNLDSFMMVDLDNAGNQPLAVEIGTQTVHLPPHTHVEAPVTTGTHRMRVSHAQTQELLYERAVAFDCGPFSFKNRYRFDLLGANAYWTETHSYGR